MTVMESTANFKMIEQILKLQQVERQIEYHMQYMVPIKDFLISQGNLVFCITIVILFLLITFLFKKVKPNSIIVKEMKLKLMWSPVFRPLIQFYLPSALMAMGYLKNLSENKEDWLKFPVQFLKFISILILPLFSYFFLKTNFHKLDHPEFRHAFGTLYTNLYPAKSSAY